MSRQVWLTASLLCAVLSPAAAQEGVERNVIYGMYSGTALLMDVYSPAVKNGRGVIFVAGSGWSAAPEYGDTGLKDGSQPRIWVPPLVAAGYTVFVPNHRAAPRFHYPAPVEDIQRAVRFVRHNAIRFGISASTIGGVGGSSGAHLIALMGVLDGQPTIDDGDDVNRESARLQALVLRAPPTDLIAPREAAENAVALMEAAPPGPQASKTSLVWKLFAQASPISHVSSGDAPTLLIHGDADQTVPYAQSVAYLKALQTEGIPAQLLPVPRGTHSPTFGLAPGAPPPPTGPTTWLKW